MELTLGRFGDRRLEKGGPFFWAGCYRLVLVRFGCAGWGATGPERCV
jgi:hypothetical protein